MVAIFAVQKETVFLL